MPPPFEVSPAPPAELPTLPVAPSVGVCSGVVAFSDADESGVCCSVALLFETYPLPGVGSDGVLFVCV